jgi:hypothetical protein
MEAVQRIREAFQKILAVGIFELFYIWRCNEYAVLANVVMEKPECGQHVITLHAEGSWTTFTTCNRRRN